LTARIVWDFWHDPLRRQRHRPYRLHPKADIERPCSQNFVRNTLSFIAAVVTQPLIDAMGVGWTTAMVSLFALATILPANFPASVSVCAVESEYGNEA
jgi:hypothetical protein